MRFAQSLNFLIAAVFICGLLRPAAAQESKKPTVEISKEAMEIHQSGMLFDGHNDLPWAMRQNAGSSFDRVDIAKPTEFHTDIPRLKAGGVKAQFWSVYVPASTDRSGRALIETLEQIRLVHDMCKRYPDVFEMADTAADIERISKEGKIASMIGVEGGHSIQNSLIVLKELYDQGARYMTLTHSKTLAWADSATDEPKNNGLSPFGKEVVREMNRIGMLIDLSHVSPKCMKDALEISKAPVIFSHSSARAICDVPRNVPDDVLKLTAKNGGVVMINFYSGYVVPTDLLPKSATDKKHLGDVKTICDHIDHVVNVAGIDHVGIGSDYDGVSFLPEGLEDVSGYPNITQELLNRGYDKEKIHKVLGGNVLRALKEAEVVSAKMKAVAATPTTAKELFKFTVDAGKHDRKNSLVQGFVNVGEFGGNTVTLADENGRLMLGQLSAAPLGSDVKDELQQLTFVLPELAAGASLKFTALDSGLNPNTQFTWEEDADVSTYLKRGGKPVLRYMREKLDESSPQRRYATMKVFHHVFTPTGDRLMTKGPGDGSFSKIKNNGLFPHHRGLFFGYNRISYKKDGKEMKADVWHGTNGCSQTHVKTIFPETGPVFGSHINYIDWNGSDGKAFANETREVTAFDVADGMVIEFRSRVESTVGALKFRGDPQHAGVQFRASQDVPDQTKAKTFYIRPDGVAEPGKFRNWSNKKGENEINKNHVNLPWNTVVIELPVKLSERAARARGVESENQAYSISYLDSPKNPKPSRFSERDYARFGSYFDYDLKTDGPLFVRYRLWIQKGVTTVDAVNQASRDFVEPVKVTQE
ncbi:MAG: membrane dipeptidase [Mariniblastus sp.]